MNKSIGVYTDTLVQCKQHGRGDSHTMRMCLQSVNQSQLEEDMEMIINDTEIPRVREPQIEEW